MWCHFREKEGRGCSYKHLPLQPSSHRAELQRISTAVRGSAGAKPAPIPVSQKNVSLAAV
jgi:hypothetical protein